MTSIVPLGDQGFVATLGDEEKAARWANALRDKALPGVLDVVTAYQTVGVFTDTDLVDFNALERQLQKIKPSKKISHPGALITIPVLYDGEDLAEVGSRQNLPSEAVIEAHAGQEYRVFAIGFRPGFPYAGYLPNPIRGLPRRPTPRIRVPAGSVAIVGKQTAIYPSESPGGWHLIGRTPLKIVDLETGHFPIQAGDRLRFVPIDRNEFEARTGVML